MKKSLFLVWMVLVSFFSNAQNYNITVNSQFKPMSMDEAMMYARAQAIHDQRMQQLFDEYQKKAYNYYYKADYNNFIYYSNLALNTGWCSGKLYYDRGVVYEKFHEYRLAKKEYKKAIDQGYYSAEAAYWECKKHHKEWKKSHR